MPMADVPAWARTLVLQVCADGDAEVPRLRWRTAARPTSSGVTRRTAGTISLVAGGDAVDQRLTLLHELAHWLGGAPKRTTRGSRRRSAHHDAKFYRTAFALYRRHGIPDRTAVAGEAGRYPSSLRHARAMGLEGAEEAWLERRGRLRDRAAARGPLRVVVPEHRVRLVRDGRWTRCDVCGVRVVGPVLRRLRGRGGSHVLLSRA
jgi:hypothetical protein